MSNLSFVKVKETVSIWIENNAKLFQNKDVSIETIEDNEDLLYFVLNFRKSMAAIVVAKPDFAPYRFVSFEAVNIENDIHNMIHTWYDHENTTVEEIIKNLNNSIDIVLKYSNMF